MGLYKEELRRFVAEGSNCVVKSAAMNVGPLVIKECNTWMKESAEIPDPIFLWKELFIQGEVCCLFADTNVGKSVLAVQIARDIALSGRRVLYVDFELTQKQFEIRYKNEAGVYQFPEGFLRCEINMNGFEGFDFENSVIPLIAEGAKVNQCDVIIIDNLTWLTATAEHAESAGNLMKQLLKIKTELGLSVLVLAHTPKRQSSMPITQNDLAGSKQLMNFFDSAFAIGRSTREERLRYIKQVKARTTEIVYGADNVLVCELDKEDYFLNFTMLKTEAESVHLVNAKDEDEVRLRSDAAQLHSEGMSLRKIAERLGVSKSWVAKVLKAKTPNDPPLTD